VPSHAASIPIDIVSTMPEIIVSLHRDDNNYLNRSKI
jgi:hypothetical protein